MPTAILMPKLGLTMREGTVVEWRCREGQTVRRGEIVLRIESEKVEFEVEAPADGTLRAIVIPNGTTVPCGEVLALLTETPDEAFDLEQLRAQAPAERSPASEKPRSGEVRGEKRRARATERPRASPRARRLADREGLSLSMIEGTGPDGRVTESDVQRAVEWLGPRIAIGDLRLAYKEVEGPEPTVVFLAGFGLDRTAFNRQLADLEGWRRLLAPNPRGTGGSTDPDETPFDVGCLAGDVEALLERLGVKGVQLVGSSLGAAVATEVTRRNPERIRRLVLLSPPARPDARLAAALEGFCRAGEAEDPAVRLQVMAPWLFGKAFLADTARLDRTLRGIAGAASQIPSRTLRRQAEALQKWLEGATDAYAAIDTPTLVVVGSDDALTPPEHAEVVARAIPGARLEKLDGIGHAPMVEDPERLHALLREFLDPS
jgi:pyruvate dehydrogenase E2 component (dihydrolipoamide acetyltransferase)